MRRISHTSRYPLWFLLPALVIFTVFFIGPAVVGLSLSFTNFSNNRATYDFVGLKNYRLLFEVYGADFTNSVINQFVYAVSVTVVKTALGVGVALLLNSAFRGRNAIRGLIYIPMIFSGIVMAKVFQYLLRNDGPINSALRAVGLGGLAHDWLGDPNTALAGVVATDTWLYLGWTVVIVLAALQAIPTEVIEAAQVDGAGAVRTFFSVKLPFLLPAINIAVLLTLISGLKVFDLIFAMTGGGPGKATEVMSTFVQKTLGKSNIGYSLAVQMVQIAIITVIAFAVNAYLRRREARNA